MKFRVLAVAGRGPDWIDRGFDEYAKRLPKSQKLELVRIAPAAGRQKSDTARRVEGERLLAAAGRRHMVALDEAGEQFGSRELARRVAGWQNAARDVDFVIGGADGLAPAVKARADMLWSLSPLTLPHALVRVLLVEQLYRAWTLNVGHPYHRG